MIRAQVPNAFVRAVDGNPGFGTAANEVLRLVEGENGFFCFLHDDVALDPGAIRLLVEEVYRSNGGIVGPKLVEWDRPRVLQHVGLAVDRFGEVDSMVEPGELDQEQHDAVRDVFAVPTACMMVRADLFRAIGGFDPINRVQRRRRRHLLARAPWWRSSTGRARGSWSVIASDSPTANPMRSALSSRHAHAYANGADADRRPAVAAGRCCNWW